MLDGFEVRYPGTPIATGSFLEASVAEDGVVAVSGTSERAVAVEASAPPKWLRGAESTISSLRFSAAAERTYWVVGATALGKAEVRSVPPSRLKKTRVGADYLVIGPAALLEAAKPLLDWRRSQGLRTRAVALDDVYSEFGYGETRPEAIREFLSFAYHHGPKPAPRYVLLLGDGSYDFKDYLGTGVRNLLPPLLVKTSYLWTASDPAYAAIHGEDLLPDVAIGRLPAASVEELERMVAKILTHENRGGSRGPVVLVADNPDSAGDFDASVQELASGLLAAENPKTIHLSRLGVEVTRQDIVEAFDSGASLLSYVGHGGIHLWAQENLLDTAKVAALQPQTEAPLLLTLNCLNGYFHFPYFNSLAEELLKAEGRGAVAAFAPTGLSLNDAAHRYHRALVAEWASGKHERLGDALLAAQSAYAGTGSFPELLSIYHLLADPALRIR